jgi:hypothetical protein
VKKCSYFIHLTRMNDYKLYFSNCMLMNVLLKCCKSSENETMEINGPSQKSHVKMHSGLSTKTDNMFRIHYDMWPNSANLFITRRKTKQLAI